MFCALASVSLIPAHAISGSVYATEGMHRASKADFCPAATSAATLPSCEALCANIGAPITSPIAKICGTLVRICLFTAMMPRASTATPAAAALAALPLALRPTDTRTRSNNCGSDASGPSKVARNPSAKASSLATLVLIKIRS